MVQLTQPSEVTKIVLGFVQVHCRASPALVETGETTLIRAKIFTGRCVLKDLSLAGHGSGKYPAVQCICNPLLFPIPPTKSWPFKGMMDELVMLQFLPPFSLVFLFFSPSIEDWSSAFASALRQILPLLCSLFQITLKADASFGQSPLALGFCAAVRVRCYDLWFADDMNNALLVAVEPVLQSMLSKVKFDWPSYHCW